MRGGFARYSIFHQASSAVDVLTQKVHIVESQDSKLSVIINTCVKKKSEYVL